MKKQEFRPVFLGADIGIYSSARSFYEEYGVKSFAFCKHKLWTIANSKIIDYEIIEGFKESDVIKRLIEYGESNKDIKLLLMSTSEKYVNMFVSHMDELKKYYIIPYVNKEIIESIDYKEKFYNICDELNIGHPKTIIVSRDNYKDIKIDFDYPIICKASSTTKYSKIDFPLKKKIFVINSKEELDRVLKEAYSTEYDDTFCIQEFIPGNDSDMRVLTCYCNKKHEVVFSSLGQPLLEENAPGAIGNYTAIINRVDEKILEDAKKFLRHVKYVGYANFDIKYNSKTGEYNFFEINVRLGRSNYYITGSGFNYAKYVVEEYIYNKKLKDEVIANKEALYSIIPFYVIKKYVKDKNLIKEARKLKLKGKMFNPTLAKYDINFKRLYYVCLAKFNQIIKYRKYYDK